MDEKCFGFEFLKVSEALDLSNILVEKDD